MTQKVRIMRSGRPSLILKRRIRGWRTLLGMISSQLAAPRRIAMEDEKLKRLQKHREIDEMELAIKSNRVVLLDLQIEKKQLELEKYKANNHIFTPTP